MKVLHVIPSLSASKGGPTPITLNMVRALRHSGVDACLLSTDDHGHTRLDVPLHEWTSYEGIPTYFLPRFRYPL
ncbi:MAG: group 1 glycosyl transferase, partial [Bacteroidia bacterium]|nr:group 1 glycosyl transferase [Bacteroidia bacterium]